MTLPPLPEPKEIQGAYYTAGVAWGKGYTATQMRDYATQAIAAARREWEAEGLHSCGDQCTRPACVQRREEIRAAVLAEREAAVQIVRRWCGNVDSAQRIVDAIRGRE